MRCNINQKLLVDDNYYYDVVRKNVKKYRINSKLTQQQLADLTGLTRDYICDIESLRKNKGFSIATLGRISYALNIHIEDLFKEDDKEKAIH